MITLLRSIRRKLLGETRAIPFGIASTILLECLTRILLPHGEWETVGAFALAAAIVATLIFSLPADIRASNQHAARHRDSNTTIRTGQ